MKRVCKVLSLVLLAVLVVLAVLVAGPMLLGYREMAVLSGSMEPTIPVGAVVYVDRSAAPEELAVGDVVTYRLDSDTFVTHRVISVDAAEESLVTQGDHNTVADGVIPFSAVFGRAVFWLPYLGYLAIFLRTPGGIMAMTGVFLLILLLNLLPMALPGEEKTQSCRPIPEKGGEK